MAKARPTSPPDVPLIARDISDSVRVGGLQTVAAAFALDPVHARAVGRWRSRLAAAIASSRRMAAASATTRRSALVVAVVGFVVEPVWRRNDERCAGACPSGERCAGRCSRRRVGDALHPTGRCVGCLVGRGPAESGLRRHWCCGCNNSSIAAPAWRSDENSFAVVNTSPNSRMLPFASVMSRPAERAGAGDLVRRSSING
jgi:hypothetical protein